MVKKRIFKTTLLALIAGLLLSVSSGLVAAQFTPPVLPHAFYGNVLINDEPAAIDTEVKAVGTGVKTTAYNPIRTIKEGKYGTPGSTGDKLIVQGDETLVDGTILTFYVNGVSTEQTHPWQSGNITELNLSVIIPEAAGVGGPIFGGAGGGFLPEVTANLLGNEGKSRISSIGRILDTITITSPDGKLKITIPANTIARDSTGDPLSDLTVDVDPDPPCPVPEDERIIGLAYSFEPEGATFNPPIEIVFSYEPDELPEGVLEEELIIAFCDEDSLEWISVPAVVDADNNIITVEVSHFTTFAIIGKGVIIVIPEKPEPAPEPAPAPPAPKPAPAAFSLKSMSVLPAEVDPGEAVAITVIVNNTGGVSGTHDVILKVDGVKEDFKTITLNAGESKEVSFAVSRDKAGTYQIECDGLSGSFAVKEAVVKPVAPAPTPAPEVIEEGIQWWIWLIIAAVVLVGAGTGLYFYSRRAKA